MLNVVYRAIFVGDRHFTRVIKQLDNEVELSNCFGMHSYSKYILETQFERFN
jgi:hypothetical protein